MSIVDQVMQCQFEFDKNKTMTPKELFYDNKHVQDELCVSL